MSFDLSTISGAALGRLYRRGELTPVDGTEWFLNRIANSDDPAVFIHVTPERARREAKESTKRYRNGAPLGPLDGVPVAWKDLFDIAGTVTTAGSDVYRNAPAATEDAPCVRFATQAGLVCLGKVNLTEFAYSGLGLNPHFGTPRNPHGGKTHRVPGGSSSGSAVAVASGLAPCAIGTDTGGSVRVPAAFNGIVGLKTAAHRIDNRSVFPLSKTLDTVGPLARTVEDCVLLEAALRGAAPVSIQNATIAGLWFVVPTNVVCDGVEDAVMANFSRVVAELERNGATIVRKRIHAFDDFLSLMKEHGSISAAEGYKLHKTLLDGPDRDRINSRVITRMMRGATMSAYDLLMLQESHAELPRKAAAELDDAMLLMPTVPHAAPEVAPLERDVELFHAVNIKTLRNTMIGNFLDLPGFALPSGFDAQGLPTSVLVSAPAGSEDILYQAAAAIEKLLVSIASARA